MQHRVIGIFALVMINVAAIVSLRNLPMMASHGLACIAFYLVAALLFLIPSALVCAELATGWPQAGGVYRWVKEAFGPRLGFFAMWAEWMLTITFFPALISFAAATLAYLIDPALAQNKTYMLSSMLFIFWACTFFNFLGMQASSKLASIGVILGTIIPGLMIIIMGFAWYFLNPAPHHIDLSIAAIIPKLEWNNLVFFIGVLLAFEGMELTAFHVNSVKQPKKSFPKAIFLATALILILSILGSLSLALVLPPEKINLVEGVIQSFSLFIASMSVLWGFSSPEFFVTMFACLLVVGTIATLSTWISGPSKAVLACNDGGYVPKWLKAVNKEGVPTRALLLQASLVSLLCIAFVLMPVIETAYFLLTVLATLFALLMYVLIFAAVIKLRYSQADTPRSYKIPGGKFGIWLVGGTGILVCIFSIGMSFIPPAQLEIDNIFSYKLFLVLGLALLSLPAYWRTRRSKYARISEIS
jgi:amino acid transporter